jgi:acyl-CoA thioesterase FadM
MSNATVTLSPTTRAFDTTTHAVEHPRPYVCDITIDPRAVSDVVPHVNNIEILRWFDRAAELHGDHVGYSRAVMLEKDCMWFVGRHELDYLAESWPDDDLRVATWIRNVDRVKAWRDAVIVRESDQRIIARGSTMWVLVNLSNRKPLRVPMEMQKAFDPLGAIVPTETGVP